MVLGAKIINIPPENCLCVGDSPYDLLSGKAAGCTTVKVNWTSVDNKVFEKYITPDFTINEMPELLDIITQLNEKR